MESPKRYSYDEAYQASLEYFGGNELSAKVFVDKYALRDNNNELVESNPDDMHRRLAKEFARIEKDKFIEPYSEEYIYSLLEDFRTILPQGSPMSGIGNHYQYVTLSNCYLATTPEDDYNSILDTDKELVNLSKRRGGVGLDLSKLRPTGSPTQNSARTSTGVRTWMERYSHSIREVGQSGRRGALMETLSVHHPDILAFITAKNDCKSVTGANISVRLSDEFLDAVEANENYEIRFPIDSSCPKFSEMIDANGIWTAIVHNAWERAEPGVLFWDNIIRESPADCYPDFQTRGTNPCSEIPLSELDSCRLLAVNLMSGVFSPYGEDSHYDYKVLWENAYRAQRLMDDLVDLELEHIDRILEKLNNDPESHEIKQAEINLWIKIRKQCSDGRRTGLGINALGDTIAALGIKYGSDESIEVVEKIYKTIKFAAYRCSVDMAKEIGSFPVWENRLERDNPFLLRIQDETLDLDGEIISGIELYQDMFKYGRRNINLLTTAPMGSTATQTGYMVNGKRYFNTTSGIEPLYTWKSYTRRKKGNPGDEHFRTDFVDDLGDHWMEFDVYHDGIQAWMDRHNKNKIDDTCPYVGATAEEINWTQRVKLQAAAQRHVDHAISSTINLPNDVKEEEVDKIYRAAWKNGLKGITVYRDGCRSGVLVKKEEKLSAINKTKAPVRPKKMPCEIYHTTIKGISYLVVVGLMGDDPYEVFASINGTLDKKFKEGYVVKTKRGIYTLLDNEENVLVESLTGNYNESEEAITRLVSTALRHGADISFIVHQLEKGHDSLASYSKAMARILKKYIPDDTEVKGEECPSCAAKLVRAEGCLTCKSCGYSKCS